MLESSEEVRQLVSKGKPTLIKFGAEWCHPCKLLDKKLDAMAQNPEYKWLTIAKVDVDNLRCRGIVAELEIENIPAVFLYDNGEKLTTMSKYNPGTFEYNLSKIFVHK